MSKRKKQGKETQHNRREDDHFNMGYSPKKLKPTQKPKNKGKTLTSVIYTERLGKYGEMLLCHVEKKKWKTRVSLSMC